MNLIRVGFGEKDTPKKDREYRIDGKGPVGTISEFEKEFPDEHFEITDKISGDKK